MEESTKRSMTQAPVKRSLEYDYYQTQFPNLNSKPGLYNDISRTIKSTFAGINPFAQQGIATSQRVAFGPKYGYRFLTPDIYPNSVIFKRSAFYSHYDPLKDMRRPNAHNNRYLYATNSSLPRILQLKIPRACFRQIQFYQRCAVVNGKDNCVQEQDNVISICPNFVLDGLREKKIKKQQNIALVNLEYREAMKLSPYNEGRTVANVSKKIWQDGAKLRPDTLWSDDRYVDINQKEINQAKQRIAKRQANRIHHEEARHAHPPEYDWKGSKEQFEKPIYP